MEYQEVALASFSVSPDSTTVCDGYIGERLVLIGVGVDVHMSRRSFQQGKVLAGATRISVRIKFIGQTIPVVAVNAANKHSNKARIKGKGAYRQGYIVKCIGYIR